MNPETLFKITIILPSSDDGEREDKCSIFYINIDSNNCEKILEIVLKEYKSQQYNDDPYWKELKIEPLIGKLIKYA